MLRTIFFSNLDHDPHPQMITGRPLNLCWQFSPHPRKSADGQNTLLAYGITEATACYYVAFYGIYFVSLDIRNGMMM